jgi:putative FmdB family regulatory protein
MPLFEYRCAACDSQFELLIRPGSPEPACPSCGNTAIERMLSMFAVSSDGTQRRSWEQLRDKQKGDNQKTQKERSFYEHDDHHH